VPSEAYTREICERCLAAAQRVLEWVKSRGNLP